MATELRQTLIAPNETIRQLFFPEIGYASIVTGGSGGGKVEIGLIGREGLVGASPVLLGSDRTPHHVFVQGPGEMLSIDAKALCAAVGESPSLHKLLLRVIQVQIIQTAQTAFINATYTSEIRLARWLLMSQDRWDGDELPMTHEFIAMMLGVQRSSATLGGAGPGGTPPDQGPARAHHHPRPRGADRGGGWRLRAARGRVCPPDRGRLMPRYFFSLRHRPGPAGLAVDEEGDVSGRRRRPRASMPCS